MNLLSTELVLILVSLSLSLVSPAPLYGEKGAYVGFATYHPPKKAESKADYSVGDALDSSAGSPDISRRTSHSNEDYSRRGETNSVLNKPLLRRTSAEDRSSSTGHHQASSRHGSSSHESSPRTTLSSAYDSIKDSSRQDPAKPVPKKLSSRRQPQTSSPAFLSKPVPAKYEATEYSPRNGYGGNGAAQGAADAKPVPKKPSSRRQPQTSSPAFLSKPAPAKYEATEYSPRNGYGGTGEAQEVADAPYHKATVYGQAGGGYKVADAYQKQVVGRHVSSEEDGIVLKDGYSAEQPALSGNHLGGSGKNRDYGEPHVPQPYEYGYVLRDRRGNSQHRHESGDGHGGVHGSYGFRDEHGRYRSVQYVADRHGFRASVLTNEPGTEDQDPADVKIKVEKH